MKTSDECVWRPRPKPDNIQEAIAEYRAAAERNKRAKEVRALIARRRKQQQGKKLEDQSKKVRAIQRRNSRRSH